MSDATGVLLINANFTCIKGILPRTLSATIVNSMASAVQNYSSIFVRLDVFTCAKDVQEVLARVGLKVL